MKCLSTFWEDTLLDRPSSLFFYLDMLRAGKQKDIEKLQESFWNQKASFFTWGNEDMDVMLPNITRGQLIVLAGSQSSGKTTWSIEMAKANAEKGRAGGFVCGYLSLEMDPERIIKRSVERMLNIDKEDRRKGLMFIMEDLDDMKLQSKIKITKFMDTGLRIFPETEKDMNKLCTIEGIVALCDDPLGPSILFIDNLAEIEAPKIKDEYMRTDYIMRELHDITRRTDTTIVLLHHMAKMKMGEPLTINSVKGNNIIVTKPDVVVAIDRHQTPNFNWECQWKDKAGAYVDRLVMNKFKSVAPRMEVRSIHIFKDRDYNMKGVAGYMQLVEGMINLLTKWSMKEKYPLKPEEDVMLTAALKKYKLLPVKRKKEKDAKKKDYVAQLPID